MAKMFNRARMTVTSTGTGALSLGVAVAGYQTFSSAGAQNGDNVSYAIEDGLKWEIGTGTYNSVAGTLSRTVTQSFDGTTYGTSAISVTTSAQVFISPLAADLQYGTSAGNLVQLDGSARLPAVDGSLVTGLNASNISSGTIASARVPTLNQNTTGTAAGLSSTLVVGSGGTGTSTAFTAGSVVFAGTSGVYSQNNSQLFWNNSLNRLGIGTGSPGATLDIQQSASTQLKISRTGNNAVFTLFMGSTDTYLSATNTSAALIFATQDVEKMRLDASGNLGVGVTPSAWPGQSASYYVAQIGKAAFYDAGGNAGRMSFNAYISSVGTNTYIANGYATRYDQSSGQHVWYNAPNNTSGAGATITFTPAMTLDASGNVGIGTTSPQAKLHVSNSGAAGLEFFTNFPGGGVGTYIQSYNRSGSAYVNTAYFAASHAFRTNSGSDAMTLDASGRLLLGNTSNFGNANCQVYGANQTIASAVGNIAVMTTDAYAINKGGSISFGGKYASDGSYQTFGAISGRKEGSGDGSWSGYLAFQTGATATERMRIDSSGNVGIGTSSPSAILQVNSTASIVRPSVTATTGYTDWVVANSGGNLYFGIDNSAGGISGTAYARHIYSDGAYPLDFFTNSTKRMTLDASGSLLVGTTSSSFIWNAGSTTTAKMAISDSGFDILNLISTANNPCLDFSQPNASGNVFRYAAVKGVMTTLTAGSEAGALTFNTSTGGANSAERMRIDSSGNVGIGATPSNKLDVVGTAAASQVVTRVANTSGTNGSQAVLSLDPGNSGFNTRDGQIRAENNGSNQVSLLFYTPNASTPAERMRLSYTGDIYIGQQTGAAPPTSGADVVAGGLVINPSRRTTAATTPVCVWDSTSGTFNRSTSSLKYKRDVQDATYGLSDVLNLRPVTFKGKSDGDRVFGGLIAEEVDSVGLTMFVDYAEDGTPDGLGYSAMVSLAFKAIQELAAEVAELKAKVA